MKIEVKDLTHLKSYKKMNKIFSCIDNLDISCFKKNINNENIFLLDNCGDSIIHMATLKDSKELIQEMLKLPISLNCQNNAGKTALHYAAELGLFEIAKILTKNNADLHIEDNHGNQPLWVAVFNDKGFGNRLKIIKLFLDAGADIFHKNCYNMSPIDFAKKANYYKVIELLEEYCRQG